MVICTKFSFIDRKKKIILGGSIGAMRMLLLQLFYTYPIVWSHCGATIASVCVGCVLGVDLDFKEAVIRQNALGGGIGPRVKIVINHC